MLKKEWSMFSCRFDPDLKSSWVALCDQLGLSPSCCIIMLAKQMVRDGSLPFTPSVSKKGSDIDE